MGKRTWAVLLMPILIASFASEVLAIGAAPSGKWEPDPGGPHLQYKIDGGVIDSVSERTTHRNLVMLGNIKSGESLSISCAGTQPARDTSVTTFQSTRVMAFIKSSPRAELNQSNEADEHKKFKKNGSVSVSASYTVPKNATSITAACYISPTWYNTNGGHNSIYYVQVDYQVVEGGASASQANRQPAGSNLDRNDVPVKDPKKFDSGVRFSSISGEVSVRPNDEDDDSYEFAEMDMVLYDRDRIRAIEKSGAVLSFSDLSTFELKEESVIVLNVGHEKSRVNLFFGKLWVNVKKMVLDGNMDVEMNQAVAGIKATIFICEDDGKTSRIKVLEGSVTLTPPGQRGVTVSAGEQASVTNGVLSRVSDFDIEEELKTWGPKSRSRIIQALKERGVDVVVKDGHTHLQGSQSQGRGDHAAVGEGNAAKATYGWVLTERKQVHGDIPKAAEGGESRVEFGTDQIEMLLAKPFGNGGGGSRDYKNPQRLHARYSWTVPEVIQPGGQVVIAVKQEVISSKTGKWANAFGLGIAIENNWYIKGKTEDGTPVEPWVLGVGQGRPDWAQKDAFVTYERTWLWNKGGTGEKRTVSVSIQGVGNHKFEYVYRWKDGDN